MPRPPRFDSCLIHRAKTLSILNILYPDIVNNVKDIYREMYPPKNRRILKPDDYENTLLKRLCRRKSGEEKIAAALKYVGNFRQYVMNRFDSGFDQKREIDVTNALCSLIEAVELLFVKNHHLPYYRSRIDQLSQLHQRCINLYKKLYAHFNTPGRKFPPEYIFHAGSFYPGAIIDIPRPVTPFNPNSEEFTPPTSPSTPISNWD